MSIKHLGSNIGLAAILGLSALAVACSGSQAQPEQGGAKQEAHGEHGDHHGGDGHHDADKGPLGQFHDVLAPVWHSKEGDERAGKACEQAAAMKDKATLVASGETPEHAAADAPGWKEATTAAVTAADDLAAECARADKDTAGVEAKLDTLHNAFHKLIERAEPHH